ncbi:MAG: hypothetical protein AAFR71_06485 [Pseudomonadota bacterium]
MDLLVGRYFCFVLAFAFVGGTAKADQKCEHPGGTRYSTDMQTDLGFAGGGDGESNALEQQLARSAGGAPEGARRSLPTTIISDFDVFERDISLNVDDNNRLEKLIERASVSVEVVIVSIEYKNEFAESAPTVHELVRNHLRELLKGFPKQDNRVCIQVSGNDLLHNHFRVTYSVYLNPS